MKTVLIDKSLVNVDFMDFEQDHTDKKAMFMYVCALIEAGAAYVELDFQSLIRLPKPSGAENYVYRIGAPEEFVVANALDFSYTVVPLKYSYILPQLELPTILEIDVGDASTTGVFDALHLISTNIDLSKFNMLRLVGDFDSDTIPAIINTYRRRSVIPVDICPKNTKLSALDSAIAAYRAYSDAVTVSFGDSEDSASLEEVLIMLSSMYKIVVSPDYLEGICKASLFSAMFSEVKKTNLSMMMSKYMYCPINIENIDAYENLEKPQTERFAPRVRMKNRPVHRNPAARVLYSLGIEREVSDKIIEIIEECNMDIFGESDKDEDLQ